MTSSQKRGSWTPLIILVFRPGYCTMIFIHLNSVILPTHRNYLNLNFTSLQHLQNGWMVHHTEVQSSWNWDAYLRCCLGWRDEKLKKFYDHVGVWLTENQTNFYIYIYIIYIYTHELYKGLDAGTLKTNPLLKWMSDLLDDPRSWCIILIHLVYHGKMVGTFLSIKFLVFQIQASNRRAVGPPWSCSNLVHHWITWSNGPQKCQTWARWQVQSATTVTWLLWENVQL